MLPQTLSTSRPAVSVYKLSLVNDNMTRAIKLPIVYAVPEGQGRECVSVV